MASPFISSVKDANLTVTKALPAAASTTVTSDAIDLGENAAAIDVVVSVPALSATILPNAKTLTTAVEVSNDSAFGSYSTISTTVQTGASSAGAAAISVRASVPPVFRYVRAKCVTGVDATNASALSATLAATA